MSEREREREREREWKSTHSLVVRECGEVYGVINKCLLYLIV